MKFLRICKKRPTGSRLNNCTKKIYFVKSPILDLTKLKIGNLIKIAIIPFKGLNNPYYFKFTGYLV